MPTNSNPMKELNPTNEKEPDITMIHDNTASESALNDALNEVERYLRTYCYLPTDDDYTAVTLFIAATYLTDHWQHYPRLVIKAPSKACGKTRLGEVATAMSFEGRAQLNPTPAVTFRMLDMAWKNGIKPPMLFFDEMQDMITNYRKGNSATVELFSIIKGGFERDATVPRCVGVKQVPKEFRAGCMLILAGIGDMPDEVESRGIVIRMQRRGPGDHVTPLQGNAKHALREVGTRLSAALNGASLASPEVPVVDRDYDLWLPLLTVAATAGEAWTAKAKAACVAITERFRIDDDDNSRSINLLKDIARAFVRRGDDGKIHTGTLLQYLRSQDDQPWGTWDYNGYSLRRDLKQFGIKSNQSVRVGGEVTTGFYLSQFADVLRRYGIV